MQRSISLKVRALRALLALPPGLQRRLPIPVPTRVAGRELAAPWRTVLFLRRFQRLPAVEELSPTTSRTIFRGLDAVMGGPSPRLAEVRDGSAPGLRGSVPFRLYVPLGARDGGPLLVYFHGGGFVDGSLATHDGLCRAMAAGSGVRLLSVGYRLAPEHPFPEGLGDGRASFAWAVERARALGAEPQRVGVGGDSSGANFAAVICQEAARGEGPRPAFQVLIYPLLDMSRKSPSFELFGRGYGLEIPLYDWYMDQYLPELALRSDLRASPILAEESALVGVAPTLLATAGFDILHDEGVVYARRLAAAGVAVDERCYEDLIHGFSRCLHVMPEARRAIEDIAARLGALAGGS